MKYENLTGKNFGKWIVLSFSEIKKGSTMWNCKCECGVKKDVTASSLKYGRSTNCGCVRRIHGKSKSPTFDAYYAMRSRCMNPKNKCFSLYGGRGITICERWMRFENFIADMGEKPPGLTLERMDRNRGYSPENCKWATLTEQARNTSRNRMLTIDGVTLTLSEWSRKSGVPYQAIHYRIDHAKWDHKKAVFEPSRKRRK